MAYPAYCTSLKQGVVTSVLSLMLGIVADHSSEYAEAVPRSVARLKEVCF